MNYVTLQPQSVNGLSNPSTSGTSRGLELANIMSQKNNDGYIDGLNCLEKTSFLHVQQQMPLDLKAGCGGGNTYHIKSATGERLLYAVEDDNCVCRWLCGPHRMFRMVIYNKQDEPVLYLERESCRCDWWCCLDCCCCQHKLLVKDASGQLVGSLRERFHIFNLKLDVCDSEGEILNKVRGTCCPCRCCTEINFDILNTTGSQELGYILKQWGGEKEWVNMDHENFHLQFPEYSSLKQKAVLLGAAFLVNFMYFEMS